MNMFFKRFGKLLFALLMALSMAVPGTALAGGYSNLDFGGRRMGMFAVVGKPDDLTAVFHNPAGLTLQSGTQLYFSLSNFVLDLGLKLYDSKGDLRPYDHEITPNLSYGAIPFIGVSSDLGTERFRLAFAIYAPNAYGASLPVEEATRYHATQALFVSGRATVAAAYDFNDHITVGASLSLLYTYLMAQRYLNTTMLPSASDVQNDPKYDARFNSLEENMNSDIILDIQGDNVTWAFDVGILVKPVKSLSIGLVFSSGSELELRGDVKATWAKDGSLVGKTKQTTSMIIPLSIRAGINWAIVPNFEIAADVSYWHYQTNQMQVSALDDKIAGLSGFTDPKNFGNSWNWCVGILYRPIPELDLMAGYQMDYTPNPTSTMSLENPGVDQKGFSVGGRWRINDHWRISLAYVHNWFNLIDVQDSIGTPPANAKGHGANNEFAFDFQYRF
ncbi:MAG TPA: outer membrane protein transport protein [Myxococcota bacterium]|nr:outer membrane protein transport protein [Myxococcota bacterium]HNZ04490.1 outer membrane protein transport protein [Myxococcota bacterium]